MMEKNKLVPVEPGMARLYYPSVHDGRVFVTVNMGNGHVEESPPQQKQPNRLLRATQACLYCLLFGYDPELNRENRPRRSVRR